MVLENKLNISNDSDLAREEERISKLKAKELFESSFLDTLDAGTFDSLSKIHKFLFDDIYFFCWKYKKRKYFKRKF